MQLKHLLFTIASIAAISLPILPAQSEMEQDSFVEERRLRLWSSQTKNRDLVYSTYLRVDHLEGTDPGSWVYEWSNIGKYFADRAEAYAASDEREATRDAFLNAAKFYGIARFPAKTLPGQLDAYRKHLQYYKRAGEFFDPALIVLDIPYDGKTIQAYLHMPPDIDKPPLILWNGGIDTWKGDSYNNVQPYIDRGFAVLTFDVLGTGENSGWAAEPDSNNCCTLAIDGCRPNGSLPGANDVGLIGNKSCCAIARFCRDAAYALYSAVVFGTSILKESLPPNMNTQTSAR